MSKVYVITSGEYSDYRIIAIFSTEEKAREYIKNNPRTSSDENEIEEWEIGCFTSKKVERPVYICDINITTGEIINERVSTKLAHPEERVGEKPWFLQSQSGFSEHKEREFWPNQKAESFVSAGHARKLAVEMRQEFLRVTDGLHNWVMEHGKYFYRGDK